MILAGKLDRTITIERATTTIGADGTPATTWTTVAVLRAELRSNAADDTAHASGSVTATTVAFRTRWADVLVGDRVVYRSDTFDVDEVVEIGRRQGLDLRCSKRGR